MSNLAPGSVISHYRIIELIARGGMGEVYKAVDTSLSRTVAIKIPNETVVENSKAKRRFLHEAHAASRLSHPNICRIYEVGEDGETPFFVMEYIEGPTLQKVLTSGPLTVEQALRIAVQLADAIEEAHNIGIIHRDLKPSNIILNSRGAPVILDFGLAKRLRQHESHDDETPTVAQSLTTGATVLGTVAYMSPEQVRAATLDARSDIFSFGILLYEMLVGLRPFNGAGQVEIMHAILHDEPPPPSSLKPEIDPELERIVGLALKKDVAQRYAAMADLKRDLYSLVRERGYDLSASLALGSGSRSGSTTPPRTNLSTAHVIPQKTSWLSRSGSRWISVLALALCIAVAGVIWLVWHRPGDDPYSTVEQRTIYDWKSDLEPYFESAPRFSRDGRQIVFIKGVNGQTHLWIKQIASGNAEILPGSDGNRRDSSPIISPNDTTIAYLSNRGGQYGIWTIPMSGGIPQFRKEVDPNLNALVSWSRDGETIYYRRSLNLYALNLQTGHERRLTNFPSTPMIGRDITISPDERRIAYYDIQNGQLDIWIASLEGGPPTQVTNDPAPDEHPLWHPDGERIIYNSTRDGQTHIFVVGINGGEPSQLRSGNSDCTLADISPDGTRILYQSTLDEADLWAVQTKTGSTSIVTSDVGIEYWPDLSTDGTKIAYQSKGGQNVGGDILGGTIMSRELNVSGSPLKLTQDGFAPQWSKDGRHLAFLRLEPNPSSLWVVSSTGGQPTRLAGSGVMFGFFNPLPFNRDDVRAFSWHPNSQEIVYAAIRDKRSNLWLVNVAGTPEKQLTSNETSSLRFVAPLWSPDGRQIAYLRRAEKVSEAERTKWSIWIHERESSKSRPIYETEKRLFLLGWGEGGNEILIELAEGLSGAMLMPATLYRVSLADKSAQPIGELSSVYNDNVRLAPDGRAIAYVKRTGGSDQLEIIPIPGGPARQLVRSDNPFTFISGLTWSPDGKTIYFSKQTKTYQLSMIDRFK